MGKMNLSRFKFGEDVKAMPFPEFKSLLKGRYPKLAVKDIEKLYKDHGNGTTSISEPEGDKPEDEA